MWTYKKGEREVGKGLVFFVCWLIVQAVVIIILEGLHLLPGDLLGVELRPRYYFHARVDVYTTVCGLVGLIYTGIGCVIMRLHEVNFKGMVVEDDRLVSTVSSTYISLLLLRGWMASSGCLVRSCPMGGRDRTGASYSEKGILEETGSSGGESC